MRLPSNSSRSNAQAVAFRSGLRVWCIGYTTEPLLNFEKDTRVAYAMTRHVSPRIGTTWWIVDKDKRKLQIAESFGGQGLAKLVQPLIVKKRAIFASPKVAAKLDELVSRFEVEYMEREHGRARRKN